MIQLECPHCHKIIHVPLTRIDVGNMYELHCSRCQGSSTSRSAPVSEGVSAMSDTPEIDPFDALLADYELQIRCARRCAYDLRHAVDMIDRENWPGFIIERMGSKARHWVSLFARGNPGKDYRVELLYKLETHEEFTEAVLQYFAEHGGVPDELVNAVDRVKPDPF